MRKIAATYIFPGNRSPVKNGILVCDDDGTVKEVLTTKGKLTEHAGLEFYSGIIVPGFVNAHCHLELSHLKGKIPEKEGIGNFVGAINKLRNDEPEIIKDFIKKADRQMWAAGISAVGDISNSINTLEVKLKSKIFYYTFAETFGFYPSRAERAFEIANSVYNEFVKNNLKCSVVPHSPYSVSKPLFEKIKDAADKANDILTIHNQESEGETKFYLDGTGPIADHLQHNLGLDISHWEPSGKSSLVSILQFVPDEIQLLLVHNTFTGDKDIEELKNIRSMKNTFLVLCPNSNLFIENQLPPVDLFKNENLNICIGTDSLSSNHQLSVLSEIITIQSNFPHVNLEDLIKWATWNGAKALKMEHRLGSLEPGKNPGINLITGIDFKNMKFTGKSRIKRLA